MKSRPSKESWGRRAWEGWKKFAHKIGNFNSRVILTLFYFVVVGIVSVLVGRWQNYMRSRLPEESNWLPVATREPDLSDARKQF